MPARAIRRIKRRVWRGTPRPVSWWRVSTLIRRFGKSARMDPRSRSSPTWATHPPLLPNPADDPALAQHSRPRVFQERSLFQRVWNRTSTRWMRSGRRLRPSFRASGAKDMYGIEILLISRTSQAKNALSVTKLASSLPAGSEPRGHHCPRVSLEGEDFLAAVDQKSTHGHQRRLGLLPVLSRERPFEPYRAVALYLGGCRWVRQPIRSR